MKKLLVLGLVVGLFLSISGMVIGSQEEAAEFYEGKDIIWVVPYSPGGGFDTYSRGIAPYLEKHIPAKNVEVVVTNIPGAGSIIGHQTVYGAKPDGTTIGIFNGPGAAFNQVTMNVLFDLRKISWIGRFVAEPHLLVVGKQSNIDTIEDLMAAEGPIKMSATGVGSDDFFGLAIVARVLGLDFDLVAGFKGSEESNAAVLRGDVVGTQTTMSTAMPLVKSGDFVPILQVARERSETLPDVPTLVELAPEDKKDLAIALTNIYAIGRAVGGPPNLPEDRLTLLRETFWNAINDPEFIEWSKKVERPLSPLKGEEVEQIVDNALKVAEDLKPILKAELEKQR